MKCPICGKITGCKWTCPECFSKLKTFYKGMATDESIKKAIKEYLKKYPKKERLVFIFR